MGGLAGPDSPGHLVEFIGDRHERDRGLLERRETDEPRVDLPCRGRLGRAALTCGTHTVVLEYERDRAVPVGGDRVHRVTDERELSVRRVRVTGLRLLESLHRSA